MWWWIKGEGKEGEAEGRERGPGDMGKEKTRRGKAEVIRWWKRKRKGNMRRGRRGGGDDGRGSHTKRRREW